VDKHDVAQPNRRSGLCDGFGHEITSAPALLVKCFRQ
jgi:hypothetical protein